jgi:hypothetical protein
MLTQMFRPGVYEENLQVAIRMLDISKDSPMVCAVAASKAFVLVYRRDKLLELFRVYRVLDRHQGWPGVLGRGILIQYRGQPPMNPGGEIDSCVRQLQK